MKQADLNRQGSVGQFYAADGGRIGYAMGGLKQVDPPWDNNSKLGYRYHNAPQPI